MNLTELIVPLKLEKTGFDGGIDTTIKKLVSFAAVAAGIAAVVAITKKAIDATMKWADEMDSLQDVTGASNEAAAAWNFTLRKSGVATETLAKGMVILNKGLVDSKGKLDVTGKALKDWGINVFDSNGQLKDQETLLRDVSDRYNQFSTQQEKVNFLTEVFGKSGADLIDFFDTLAADGGIDAVTKKVEALGLAIDPNRYEQFNRNLEEMKLIGLSLAVAFTERLMPILETLTKWIVDKGIPGFIEFKNKILAAFDSGGLAGALAVLDDELAKAIDSIDWAGLGTKFGEFIEQALGQGIGEVDLPKFAVELGKGIREFLIASVGEENVRVFKEHFVDYVILQLNRLDVEVNRIVREAFTEMGETIQSTVSSAMEDLSNLLENKLREIGKKFFTRALGWTQQARAGFEDGIGNVLNAVSNIVDEINGILKKIITHFRITFSFGGQTQGTSGTASLGGGSVGSLNTTSTQNAPGGGRASGGAVIAGQSYKVFDTFKDEIFTPNKSGRIDSLDKFGSSTIELSDRTIDKLAERLGLIIPTATVKAMNSV